MLRIHFLQRWFNLSDPHAEEAIYDSASMRRFVGLEFEEDRAPDETTILRFRHLLEEYNLTKTIHEEVHASLSQRRLLLRSGAIEEAAVVHAPSQTTIRRP